MTQSVSSQTTTMAEAQKIKKKIIEAASRLYARKGLAHTSVEDIASEAGVHPSVTYQFVRNKSSIMEMIMEDILFQFQEEIRPRLGKIQDPREKLLLAMDLYFRIVQRERDKALLVYQESNTLSREARHRIMALEVDTMAIFREILQEGVRAGLFVDGHGDILAYNIVILSHLWVLKGWHLRNRLNFEDFLALEKDFVLRAVGKT